MNPSQLTAAMLSVVSLLYGIAAIGYYLADRPAMAACFVGYIVANVGLIWDALK